MTKSELLAALARRGYKPTSFRVASGRECPAVTLAAFGDLHVIHDLVLECWSVGDAARLIESTRRDLDAGIVYWPPHLLDAETEAGA